MVAYTNAETNDNGIAFLNAIDDKLKSMNKPDNLNDFKKYNEIQGRTVPANFFIIDGEQIKFRAPTIYYSDKELILNAENIWVTLSKKSVEVENPSMLQSYHKLEIKINQISYHLLINSEPVLYEIYCLLSGKKNKSTPSEGIADELKKFKELLDSGAITQEEYDTKKKELLDL